MQQDRRELRTKITRNITWEGSPYDFKFENMTDHLTREKSENEILNTIVNYIDDNYQVQTNSQSDKKKHQWRFDLKKGSPYWYVWVKNKQPRKTLRRLLHQSERKTQEQLKKNYLGFKHHQKRQKKLPYEKQYQIVIDHFGPFGELYKKDQRIQQEKNKKQMQRIRQQKGEKTQSEKHLDEFQPAWSPQSSSGQNTSTGETHYKKASQLEIENTSTGETHYKKASQLEIEILATKRKYKELLNIFLKHSSQKKPILGFITKLLFVMLEDGKFLSKLSGKDFQKLEINFIGKQFHQQIMEINLEILKLQEQKEETIRNLNQFNQQRSKMQKKFLEIQHFQTQKEKQCWELQRKILDLTKRNEEIDHNLMFVEMMEHYIELMDFSQEILLLEKYFKEIPDELFNKNIQEYAKMKNLIQKTSPKRSLRYSDPQQIIDEIFAVIISIREREITKICNETSDLTKDEKQQLNQIIEDYKNNCQLQFNLKKDIQSQKLKAKQNQQLQNLELSKQKSNGSTKAKKLNNKKKLAHLKRQDKKQKQYALRERAEKKYAVELKIKNSTVTKKQLNNAKWQAKKDLRIKNLTTRIKKSYHNKAGRWISHIEAHQEKYEIETFDQLEYLDFSKLFIREESKSYP